MGSVSLDEINKAPGQLEEEEIKKVQESWGDLSEEDQEKYKQYSPETFTPPTEGDPPVETEEPEPEPEPEPEKPSLTENKIKNIFRSELEDYLKKRDPEEPVTEEEKKWFGENFQPKSYDEFAEQFYQKAVDRMQKEAQQRRREQEEKIEQANKKITEELNRVEGVPEEGTPERQKFEKDFTQWAIDYGVTGSVPKAVELYKKVNQEQAPKKDTKKKDTLRKINKSGGGSSNVSINKTYSSDIRDRSMDDIIAESISKWNEMK